VKKQNNLQENENLQETMDEQVLTGNDDLQKLQSELEETKTRAEEYYSGLQRLKAEFDNFRKRTVREKDEAAKYASERIILSLLPIVDNFERALDSTKTNKDFESFSQGIEMILRQLFKVLEDEGLKPIDAVGHQFDPNLHEALFIEESDLKENTVLEELQKGYLLKEKVIRPGRVKVSG